MSRERLQTIQALSKANDRYEQTGERAALEALVAARFALRRPRPTKRPEKHYRTTLENFRVMEPYLARMVREWPATQDLTIPAGGLSPITIRDKVRGAIHAYLHNSTDPHWQPSRCLGYSRSQADALFPAIRVATGEGKVELKATRFSRKPAIPEINVSSPDKGCVSTLDRGTIPGIDRRGVVSAAYMMDGGYVDAVVWLTDLSPEDEEMLERLFDVEITDCGNGLKGMRPLNDFERMIKAENAA